MRVGVGFSENTDSHFAGVKAAQEALKEANRDDPCDLVLLFCTAQHDPEDLFASVSSVVGSSVPIIGGGAVGAITNDRFGYAGDQVGLAAIWLDGISCNLFTEGGIIKQESDVGLRLGQRLAARGVQPETPSILFYDAINNSSGNVELNLATPLIEGIERGLGFLPSHMVGAGLQGDFDCSASRQFVGYDIVDQQAMLLTFSDELRIDSVIMHGCRPAGEYFTVTKSDGQTILEINDEPALTFIEKQLHNVLPADEFPFFIIFGINRGAGDEYNELDYVNRLCLAIDRDRNGIVMFESDMVAETRFQIMYRSLDLAYIPPRINHLFKNLGNRKPVFAFYIDCAGRAAQYSTDLEDAIVVQKAVANRVPLLGIYSGVEISPVKGKPRTLDWTGVFCLFSVPEE